MSKSTYTKSYTQYINNKIINKINNFSFSEALKVKPFMHIGMEKAI